VETDCLKHREEGQGRPLVGDHVVEAVRGTYARSSKKCISRASLEPTILQPTVWRILRRRLQCVGQKLQLGQALSAGNKQKRL
jgi:hypothetical protein